MANMALISFPTSWWIYFIYYWHDPSCINGDCCFALLLLNVGAAALSKAAAPRSRHSPPGPPPAQLP